MNILVLGAAGFIGTNLIAKLAENDDNSIVAVDCKRDYFSALEKMELKKVTFAESAFSSSVNFEKMIENQDVVYHLVSTTVPTTSNRSVLKELNDNIALSTNLIEACARKGVKKIVFMSSGGTVYGKNVECPIPESAATNPITAYGLQKLTIEKILYLYHNMYGLDYNVIRLANPYGPYQRPNGILGAVTTFTYKALKGEPIQVYGDGTTVRDYIYIDDAVDAIIKIAGGSDDKKIFNVGSGNGTSLNMLLKLIEKVLETKLTIGYTAARQVDVPVNYLDIRSFEEIYGKLENVSMEDGIRRTADYLKKNYI